jgi:ATP-binding cassette, subfamily B (MDR/TAP), member 1
VFAFVPDVSSARTAASDIVTLLDSKPEIDADSASGKSLTNVAGKLHLESVHFRYPSRPEIPVLRGLSLTVDPGTYIALAGASGSGKSTMYVYCLRICSEV